VYNNSQNYREAITNGLFILVLLLVPLLSACEKKSNAPISKPNSQSASRNTDVYHSELEAKTILGNAYETLMVKEMAALRTGKPELWKLIKFRDNRLWIREPLVKYFDDAGVTKKLVVFDSQPPLDNGLNEPCEAHVCGASINVFVLTEKDSVWSIESGGWDLLEFGGTFGRSPEPVLVKLENGNWDLQFTAEICFGGECGIVKKSLTLINLPKTTDSR